MTLGRLDDLDSTRRRPGCYFLGARLGGIAIGIAIGFAGGLGVVVLALLGVTPGDMPLGVISVIMAVICAIAAMQIAGGMDYLVSLAERILRRNRQRLTFLAPAITYLMTVMAGTGHCLVKWLFVNRRAVQPV